NLVRVEDTQLVAGRLENEISVRRVNVKSIKHLLIDSINANMFNSFPPEIQQWYIGWRLLLPETVVNHTIIKEKLRKSLVMIERRMPQASPPQSYTINNCSIKISSSTIISSIKGRVEKEATKHNQSFLSIPNRTFSGKTNLLI
ncbi:unnamed protein product, partial [Rotaria sp. Silwood1]